MKKWLGFIANILILLFLSAGCLVTKGRYLREVSNKDELIQQKAKEIEELEKVFKEEREKGEKKENLLKENITKLEKERDALTQEVSDKEKTIQDKSKEIEDINKMWSSEKKDWLAEKGNLNKEIVDLKREGEELKKRIKAKDEIIKGKLEEIANLKEENNRLREDLEKTNRDLEILKIEKDEAFMKLMEENRRIKEEFQDYVKKAEIEIKEEKGRLIISFIDRILFDSGSSEIKKEAHPALEKVAEIIKNYPNREVLIEGHTDNVPIHTKFFPSNWELSTSRATQVLRYLQWKYDISPRRLSAAGYGEYRPVDTNDTKEGRRRNRRVEIILLPERFERKIER
ncbi:MAG: OmpA family protein [bacterium]|nr:OmpA family protein [bacterium]